MSDYVSHRAGIPHGDKTLCINGHDLTNPANVRLNTRGSRSCRACKLTQERERRLGLRVVPRRDPRRRALTKVLVGDECWHWIGATGPHGYGIMRVDKRKVQAHRFMYELMVGPIPEGLQIDHLCRVRHCVRPDHLEPVTQAENIRRGALVNTHCRQGHEYTPENTHIDPHGHRKCKTCRLEQQRRYTQMVRERAA